VEIDGTYAFLLIYARNDLVEVMKLACAKEISEELDSSRELEIVNYSKLLETGRLQ